MKDSWNFRQVKEQHLAEKVPFLDNFEWKLWSYQYKFFHSLNEDRSYCIPLRLGTGTQGCKIWDLCCIIADCQYWNHQTPTLLIEMMLHIQIHICNSHKLCDGEYLWVWEYDQFFGSVWGPLIIDRELDYIRPAKDTNRLTHRGWLAPETWVIWYIVSNSCPIFEQILNW